MKLVWGAFARRHWKPLALILEVLLMAGLYQAIWEFRPDYFRVADKLNELPLDMVAAAHSYRDTSGRPLPQFADPDIDEALARARRVYSKMQALTAKIEQQKSDLDRRRRVEAARYRSFEASQWQQAEAYRQTKIAPFRSKIEAIEANQNAILAGMNVASADDLPSGQAAIEYADLSVKAAELRVQAARVEVAVSDYILHNLPAFQKTRSQQAFLAYRKQTGLLEQQMWQNQLGVYELNQQFYNAFTAYLSATKAKLSYADFVYFSIGGATTATFGDIMPNHTSVRLLFSLQIVISMVLVSLWINDLSNRRRNSELAGD